MVIDEYTEPSGTSVSVGEHNQVIYFILIRFIVLNFNIEHLYYYCIVYVCP